jgi:choloylglycine hydrolase
MVCFRRGVIFIISAVFFLLLINGDALACSRVLSADNGQAVLAGRNMDWPDTFGGTDLWVLPRGMERNGLVAKNTLKWRSKYASLVAVTYVSDQGKGAVSDGMNEKGLAANMLWLEKSDYGVRNERLPGLSLSLWAQYFLDNYSTVEEAVNSLKTSAYQIVTMVMPGSNAAVTTAYIHLSLEDKTGDSAIIEYIAGKPVIHHNRKYTVMTNDPPFEEQLNNLKQYEGFGGNKPLPGSIKPEDRFVRAAYYLKYLPKPANIREAIAGIISITRNVAQPFTTTMDPKHPNAAATIWNTIADLTDGIYYFESTTSPYLIWARLNAFDLNTGSKVMKLDLSANADRVGDVSGQFVPAKPFEFVASGKQ